MNGNLTNCTAHQREQRNGMEAARSRSIRVPIPSTYTCTSTEAGGCWFRLQVTFPGGVSDITTWSARVEGDPVRLIE